MDVQAVLQENLDTSGGLLRHGDVLTFIKTNMQRPAKRSLAHHIEFGVDPHAQTSEPRKKESRAGDGGDEGRLSRTHFGEQHGDHFPFPRFSVAGSIVSAGSLLISS